MTEGQIYKIHSDFYYVDDGVSTYECKIREVLKKQREKIFAGDFVQFENGVICNILPRKTLIKRPAVANIDQIIIVSALKEPDLDFYQLNRYIALAEYYNIPAVLCFNKDDLAWDRKMSYKIKEIYGSLGYKILYTSAKLKICIGYFEKILEGKTSVLCGGSGVGKSSLINAINPNLHLRTQEVSEKTGRGIHTTRHCEIIKINKTTKIIDTPGFSNVKFDFLLPAQVGKLFPDIYEYAKDCKFSDCLHVKKYGCNVLQNIDKIEPSRYESYIMFLNEAKEYEKQIKTSGKKEEESKKNVYNKQIAKISEKKRISARNTLKQKINKNSDYQL